MIKNFTDKDGQKFDLTLRGKYASSVTSSKKLKSLIDNSTSKEGLKSLHPTYTDELINKLAEAYSRKTYRDIMRDFGMLDKSKRITS
jgi:hypothetical protein